MKTLSFNPEVMNDLFTKHHVDGLGFPLVIHEFSGPEPLDALPHDHPGDMRITVLKGWYTERVHYIDPDTGFPRWYEKTWYSGERFYVAAEHIHQIVAMSEGGCITLVVPGPNVRKWGLWDFKGGIKFMEYVQPE